MLQGSRQSGARSVLLIVAVWASFVVVLAILFNFVKSDPSGYDLAGSGSRKAPIDSTPVR
jgi:hypothetical protein